MRRTRPPPGGLRAGLLGDRMRQKRASTTTGILALAAVLVLFSCARRASAVPEAVAPPPAPDLSWPAEETRTFVAGPDGISTLLPAVVDGDPAEAPAHRVAALAASDATASHAAEAAALVEGWGTALIRPSGGEGRIILDAVFQTELRALRVGGMWPSGEGFLIHLFHDPFTEDEAPAGQSPASSLFMLTDGGLVSRSLPDSGAEPGSTWNLFAFLPDPNHKDGWLAQFRNSEGEQARSSYLRYASLGNGHAGVLTRVQFERALTPVPLRDAPKELRLAVLSLGEEAGNSAIIRMADSGAAASWYSFGTDPSSGREIHAWRDGYGTVIALLQTGKYAIAMDGVARVAELQIPREGAFWTGLAFFGIPQLAEGEAETRPARLLLVASWESALESGLVTSAAARP